MNATDYKKQNLPPCPGAYSPQWNNCVGTYTWADGRKYVGEFRDGTRTGQGTYTYVSGSKYVGEFRDGEKHGQGTMYRRDGTITAAGVWKLSKLVHKRHPATIPGMEFNTESSDWEDRSGRETGSGFGWKKKQNKLTPYTQSPRMMAIYEQITEDPEFLESLVGMGKSIIANLYAQSAIYKGEKDLREITKTIIFPAAAEHLDQMNLVILHIWLGTKGDLTTTFGADGEMFLRYFREEIDKLPKGWNEHES